MKWLVLLTFILSLTAAAQLPRIVVLPFKGEVGVTEPEASLITNYTITHIENLGLFEVLSYPELRRSLSQLGILVDPLVEENRGILKRIDVCATVSGTISKNADMYIVEIGVRDSSDHEYRDTYSLDAGLAPRQQAKFEEFLGKESGLRDLLNPRSYLSPVPFQRLRSSFALSGTRTVYYGTVLKSYYTPLCLTFDVYFSRYVFMILGGSYVMHSVDVNPNNVGPSPSSYDTLAGTQDFWTLKGGLGIRFWRIRLFSTYDYQITKQMQDLTGQSVPVVNTIPEYFITAGLDYYVFDHLYIGTELYFYKPVDYLSDVSGNVWSAQYGTTFFPTFTLGVQF